VKASADNELNWILSKDRPVKDESPEKAPAAIELIWFPLSDKDRTDGKPPKAPNVREPILLLRRSKLTKFERKDKLKSKGGSSKPVVNKYKF
jgi:hypothetical protein